MLGLSLAALSSETGEPGFSLKAEPEQPTRPCRASASRRGSSCSLSTHARVRSGLPHVPSSVGKSRNWRAFDRSIVVPHPDSPAPRTLRFWRVPLSGHVVSDQFLFSYSPFRGRNLQMSREWCSATWPFDCGLLYTSPSCQCLKTSFPRLLEHFGESPLVRSASQVHPSFLLTAGS